MFCNGTIEQFATVMSLYRAVSRKAVVEVLHRGLHDISSVLETALLRTVCFDFILLAHFANLICKLFTSAAGC